MSLRTYLAVALSSLASVSGQISLGPSNEISDYDHNPTNTTAVDLDGDGDLDILSHEEDGSRVFWFFNDGNGGFSNQGEWFAPFDETVAYWTNLGFLDHDQDGHLDLVAFLEGNGETTQEICLVKGIPGGGFESVFTILVTTTYDPSVWNSELAPLDYPPTDLDGDDHKDLIFEDRLVLMGRDPIEVVDIDFDLHYLDGHDERQQLVDWNGDDLPDILEFNGHLEARFNQGDGVFSEPQVLLMSSGAYPEDVAMIKNEDEGETLDFLILHKIDDSKYFSVISKTSDSSAEITGPWPVEQFIPDDRYFSGWISSNRRGFVTMNNSYGFGVQKVDALRLVWDENMLSVAPLITEIPFSVWAEVEDIFEADLDGNLISDTVVAVKGPGRVNGGPPDEIFWIKDGVDGPNETIRNLISQPTKMQNLLYASDFDEDGNPDLLTLQASPSLFQGDLVIWRNINNGEKFVPQIVPLEGRIREVLKVFEIDDSLRSLGDQFSEVDWANGRNGLLVIRQVYTGAQYFPSQSFLSFMLRNSGGGLDLIDYFSFEDQGVERVFLEDLNRDGSDDLIYSSFIPGSRNPPIPYRYRTVLRLGIPGSHGFEPPSLTLENASLAYGPPADWDQDGDFDFRIQKYNLDGSRGNEVWMKNESGGFIESELNENGYQPVDGFYYPRDNFVDLDLDGDGDLDLLSPIPTNRISGFSRIGWIETKETLPTQIGSLLQLDPVGQVQPRWANRNKYLMVDIDNDGADELVVGSQGFARLEWFEVIHGEQPPAYRTWADQRAITGHSSAPAANWDGDSLTNWEEFAFGSDPKRKDDSHPGRPGIAATPSGPTFTYHRRTDAQAHGIIYQFLKSGNLINWSPWAPIQLSTVSLDSDYERVSIPLGQSRSFFQRQPILPADD